MAKEEKTPAVEISYRDLRAAVDALNESKLAATVVKIVGIQKNVILKEFKDAVNSIPDNAEGKFPGPPEVLKFYNDLIDAENAFAKANTPTEQKLEQKVEESAKAEKTPKEKKEKTSTGEKKKRTGWKKDSTCDKIHQLIVSAGKDGISLDTAVKAASEFNPKEGYTKAIFSECVREGLAEKKDGKYFPIG
jgi:hypothetical protein